MDVPRKYSHWLLTGLLQATGATEHLRFPACPGSRTEPASAAAAGAEKCDEKNRIVRGNWHVARLTAAEATTKSAC
jgi:hypothetical protein